MKSTRSSPSEPKVHFSNVKCFFFNVSTDRRIQTDVSGPCSEVRGLREVDTAAGISDVS
jgi:hypothetical protein